MSHFDHLLVSDHGAVRVITLNRPEKKNSINATLATELWTAVEEAGADEQVRAVVVTGQGDCFCAGVDVTVFLGAGGDDRDVEKISNIDQALRSCPKPLLAAVGGKAVGMGVTLLPHFDLVYAGDDATFTTPFVQLGLVLEYGSSFTLPRLIGRQRTNELILRAVPIDATTALSWGLVARVFPRDELLERVLEIAAGVAARPPNAVATCKRLIRQGEESSFDEADRREREALASCYRSEENVAAVTAFLKSRGGG